MGISMVNVSDKINKAIEIMKSVCLDKATEDEILNILKSWHTRKISVS